MNEKQYRQICDACDSVLRDSSATRERMAIPWLHVLREHPDFLKEYESLLKVAAKSRYARIFRYSIGWLSQFWRAFWSDGLAWFGPDRFPKPVDILFISHLLDPSHAGSKSDFYFGDLPERVCATDRGVVLALIDHSGTADDTLADSWHQSAVSHVIFTGSLGIRGEISLCRRLWKESRRLVTRSRIQASVLLCRVYERASVEALSGNTRTTLRLAWQIGELVDRVRPKVIVVTYEGHAWERLAFAAAREVHPEVLCIGYQHAAIFRMQHSALRKLSSTFNPDRLLAAGPIGKAQLEGAPGLRGIPVTALGSSRAADGNSIKRDYSSQRMPRVCLVLPEGITSECNLLFEFSLNCAKLMPQLHFVWRLHPLVKFDDLAAGNSTFRYLPTNIELSVTTMEEDVTRANYALYRGSTAIVRAVCGGVQPIYLEQPGEMSIDPLYELVGWREKVADPAEFCALVEAPQSAIEVIARSRVVAMEYCESFYSLFQPSVLLTLLEEPQMDD